MKNTGSNRPLDTRLNELDNSIPKLEAEISLLKNQVASDAEINHSSFNLYERWDGFSEQEQISVIQSLTNKITINKNEVEIALHFIPSVITSGHLATDAHGLVAAISKNWAGNMLWYAALDRCISPLSRGWRRLSSTFRGNSASSSKNNTP